MVPLLGRTLILLALLAASAGSLVGFVAGATVVGMPSRVIPRSLAGDPGGIVPVDGAALAPPGPRQPT